MSHIETMLGLVRVGGAWKVFLGRNSLNILQFNFQLLYKIINHQYLSIFDLLHNII